MTSLPVTTADTPPMASTRPEWAGTRILLGFESVRPGNGGICRVARMMARALGEQRVAASFPMPTGYALSDPADLTVGGIPFKSMKGSRWQYLAALNRGLLRHTHFIYDCGGMARGHNWLPFPRRPFLAYLHGIEAWAETCHPKQVRALLTANVLLTNTAYTLERASRLDPGFARAEVCWLATEEDDPPAGIRTKPAPPRVTILGRLDRYKGHDELIRSWPAIRSKIPDAVLTIVGRGVGEADFRKTAAECGLTNGEVEFAGFVPDDRIDEIWRQTSVLAMPSRGEGFGLVYIEAMRHGIPVIGSIYDAAPEVNVDGITGYNVALDNLTELTDRLVALLRDPDHAATMGRAGAARWAEHFRFSAFRERFLAYFRRFVGLA